MSLKVNFVFLAALIALTAGCADDETTDDGGDPPPRARLVILSPDSGATVDGLAAELTFRVDAAPADGFAVRVGDQPTEETLRAIQPGETVAVDLALAEGLNRVRVSLRDAEGEADAETLFLLAEDDPAPVIALTGVIDGAIVFRDRFAFEGTIQSERAIAAATFAINDGEPQVLGLSGEGTAHTFQAEIALATGANRVVITAADDRGKTATAGFTIHRDVDAAPPSLSLLFPRDRQAVKTRRVLVRGTVADNDQVSRVWLERGEASVEAELDGDGGFTAWLDLEPGDNAYQLRAEDATGNPAAADHTVYFGQRLGAGGALGGAILGGQIYTWGRNNLGQTGLDYVSHESQTAWCERSGLATPLEVAICKATSLAAIQSLCDASFAGDPAGAEACRTAVADRRTAVCQEAGPSAPTGCATSRTANLWSACQAAHGAGTPASRACKINLVCSDAYTGDARAVCEATVGAVPATFPSPGTPYAPVAIPRYSTIATPAAPTGAGVPFAELGVSFLSLGFNQNAASAIDSAGGLWSWGDGASGVLCLGDQTGDVDTNDRKLPHRVAPFGAPGTRAIALSRGYDHLLILRDDGTVWACGANDAGQIGDGTAGAPDQNRPLPTQVQGLPTEIIQVHASAASSYALTADGTVYAWGRNSYGNLGQGTASPDDAAQPTPLRVPNLTGVVAIAGGRDHVLAVKADGTVWAWGLNASNQVGPDDLTEPPGDPVTSPVQVPGIRDAVAVYGNGNQGFYEDPSGRLWGWGQNGNGNLGIAEDGDQPAPTVPVFGLSNVLDTAIGPLHGYALTPTTDGDKLFAWGWSFHGSLGGGPALIHSWAYRTPLLVLLP